MRSAVASMAVGLALNTVCWRVNERMPVLGWAQQNDRARHLATNLDGVPWLWDRIAAFGFTISVGDLFLAVGLLLLLAAALPRISERFIPRVIGPGFSQEPCLVGSVRSPGGGSGKAERQRPRASHLTRRPRHL